MTLSEIIKELVALANNEQSSLNIGDTVTIQIRENYGLAEWIDADVTVSNTKKAAARLTENFREKVGTRIAENFREAVAASFSKPTKPVVAIPQGNKEWSVKVRATKKGLNIPHKAIQYLRDKSSNRYTPLYIRPIDNSYVTFLVNATRGEGECHEIYAHADGRFVITPTLQRKIWGFRLDTYRNPNHQWTVRQNGNNGNSVIFTFE